VPHVANIIGINLSDAETKASKSPPQIIILPITKVVSVINNCSLHSNLTLYSRASKVGSNEGVGNNLASDACADRPELARVLHDLLREGDTLVVWKLDRLARSLKQLIETAESLKGRAIGLVSLTDAIDTSSPGGMLVFHLLGAIAEFERALIRERTAAGLAEARRKGRVGGRPRGMQPKDVAAARALLAEDKPHV
jgi:DNA invertase Pin-like site-specific DNA recombinase